MVLNQWHHKWNRSQP